MIFLFLIFIFFFVFMPLIFRLTIPSIIHKLDAKKDLRREQAISFAYGNLKASNNHGQNITREMVAKIYDEMKK